MIRKSGAAARRAAKPGFTLIELLIVVGIIAILAAIAVPNFLEAQTRAKVSRVHADLRSLATAIEAYAVDHNAHPPNNALNPADPLGLAFNTKAMLVPLSTPVSYIASALLPDPFQTPGRPGSPWPYVYTRLHPEEGLLSVVYPPLGVTPDQAARVAAHQFYVYGIGPDGRSLYAQCLAATGSPGPAMACSVGAFIGGEFVYDPTNGTVSAGDIARSAKGIINKAL